MRLIDADALLEKFAELEATALDMCRRHMHDDDQAEWKRWSVILTERTAYRYDVLDAPIEDAVTIEFIRSEIKNSKGFYNSSLRRLLDAWEERKEE